MTLVKLTLDNTIGAAYLGVVCSSMLFGITNLQAYIYYTQYPHDWRWQRISVAVLWVLDAIHLALTIQVVYHYLVSSFGNLLALTAIIWTFKLQIAVNVVIIILVQSLYAIRTWKLGHHYHKILPWFIVLAVAAGYGVGIVLAVETYRVHYFIELDRMAWAIYLSFSTSTFIDFVIAVSMCFYLQRSRSGFSGTNSKIVTLMQYVLASGLATSACSMAALITYALLPNTLIFLGVEFLLTKIYINSFLAMLNARRTIQTRDEIGVSTSNIRSNTGFAVQVNSRTVTHVSDAAESLSPISFGLASSQGNVTSFNWNTGRSRPNSVARDPMGRTPSLAVRIVGSESGRAGVKSDGPWHQDDEEGDTSPGSLYKEDDPNFIPLSPMQSSPLDAKSVGIAIVGESNEDLRQKTQSSP